MKEFEVTLTIRNNRIKQRRLDRGLTQRGLSGEVGIPATYVNQYETMNKYPMKKDGAWKRSALKLAEYFGVEPIEIFPEVIQKIEKTRSSRRITAREATMILASTEAHQLVDENAVIEDVDELLRSERLLEALNTLNWRERQVLVRRYGLLGGKEETFAQIAEDFGRSTERIRSLEARGMVRLRKILRFKIAERY